MSDFVHLHLHTEYSLLDGACRIKHNGKYPLFERVKSVGQDAVAITDHGVMYGAVDFYNAAKESGVKPIIGCEVYVAPRTRHDKLYELDSEPRHLVLLCENMTGYKNLSKMVSMAFIEGFYIKPRVDMELLEKYSEGLIALSACLAGEIPRKLLAGSFEQAEQYALKLDRVFGRGNFFLELQNHGIPEQAEVNRGLLKIAERTGIPIVATNDVHYTEQSDAAAQDVMMCIQTGRTVNDQNRMKFSSSEFYIKSREQMEQALPGMEQAFENTVKIAQRCNVEFEFGNYKLPEFTVPDGMSSEQYLKKLAEDGFAARFPDGAGDEYSQRLEYELSMINRMGFTDYFLIVGDFISYAKSKGIAVGPGRGSGAGSLVAYCLGITGIDPIKYSLVFERFLNPERVSMPDFDIDFCYVRRPEVIEYVVGKYGADRVAQIVTFGTMAARQAIRDVGRALGMPYADVDAVAKQVPFEIGMTIDKALSSSSMLKNAYDGDPQIKRLIDMAKALEGMPRHASMHAAGVVITPRPVYEYVPLAKNDDSVVTQYTMVTLERLGLLKMDFLGLRTLTVIDDAVKMARRRDPDFDIYKIPEDDKPTFEMLSAGKTAGVFQMESEGMTNVIMGLRPESIEDITAVIALYRPGPMQYIPKYIESRHNPEKISYLHPSLEPVLKVTYGCIVYQEQVMEVFRQLAGYSLGKADMVRRAMSKKKMEQLKKERQSFIYGDEEQNIKGALANGIDRETANTIFDQIMDFANYAFNKSHAVCYAMISYRTAYLKRHYPEEFMAALLTSVLDWSDKVCAHIAHCREMGIEILPPDINLSDSDFTAADGSIRFGLAAVKGIGRGLCAKITAERAENGKFTSFYDFCRRMAGTSELNKRAAESLIKCGAFDGMGANRRQLMSVFAKTVDSAVSELKNNIEGQLDMFSTEPARREQIPLPKVEEYSVKELLAFEKESLGLYISGHPMDEYREIVAQAGGITRISDIVRHDEDGQTEERAQSGVHDGENIILAGIITAVKLKNTKSGSMMAYVTIEDLSASVEMMIFAKTLDRCGMYLKEDAAVFIGGRVSVREDEAPKIICENVLPLNESSISRLHDGAFSGRERARTVQPYPNGQSGGRQPNERQPAALYIKIDGPDDGRIKLIAAVLKMFPGGLPVRMVYIQDGKKYVSAAGSAAYDPRLKEELERILGGSNVVFK